MRHDDRELVLACLNGDPGAWDRLVDRYGRLVYSVPRKLGLSDADADDVFQVVFGIVLRRLDTLRETERLSAWLIRTTYREAWRIGRRSRAAPGELPESAASSAVPSEEVVAAFETQHLVRQAVAELDERCGALLRALFFETPTPEYQQIADRLGLRIGSIGPTRARCFEKLERVLRDLGVTAPRH